MLQVFRGRLMGRAAVALFALSTLIAALRGEEAYHNSLDIIPASVSFYSTTLQLQKQWEWMQNCPTYKKVMAVPGVQVLLGFWNMRYAIPDSPFIKWDRWVAAPENRQLANLGLDCLRDEIFFAGDEAWPGTLQLLVQAQNLVRVGQFASLLNHAKPSDEEISLDQESVVSALRLMLNQQMENRQRLVVPTLLVGCKLRDTSAVGPQLERLEEIARPALTRANIPQDCLSWQSIGPDKFLTLRVRIGSLLGDELKDRFLMGVEQFRQKIERVPGEYQPLFDHLASLNLVVSIGLKENYLLFSLGGSNELLASLGQGELLKNRAELAKIQPFQKRSLTQIGFVSAELITEATSNLTALNTFATAFPEVVKPLKIDEALKQRVLKDSEAFFNEARGLLPATGANVACAFITENGSESYAYDWSAYPHLQSGKPLDILSHVGDNPLLLAAWRSQDNPADYEFIARWSKVGLQYFEEFVVPSLQENERSEYTKWKDFVLPLVKRLDVALRTQISPALRDGQACLVLGTSSSAASWQKDMPAGSQPLPIVEPSLVLRISDEKLLREGMRELIAISREIYERILQETHSNGIPESVLEVTETPMAGATGFQVGKDYCQMALGLNEKLTPTAAISKDLAVITFSLGNAQRLIETAKAPIGGAIEKDSQPLGVAARWDWKVLLKAMDPWVTYAGEQIEKESPADANGQPGNPQAKYVVSQVHAVIDALQGLGVSTMAGYQDGPTFVYHSVWEADKP